VTGSVVVTGASAGLGLAAAQQIAAAGHHTVLACRSPERGAAAADRIRAGVPAASLEVIELDLASLASVRAAAAQLSAVRPTVSSLVCNAGVQVVDGVKRSRDGFELTFATNHLGHFLLVRLLQDQLAVPGRVLLVSSEVHQGPRKSMGFPAPRWDHPRALADPDREETDGSARAGRVRYATSKLANLYLTYELARRSDPDRLTATAFDPGLMPETGLDRDYPPLVRAVYHRATPLLVRALPGARSVAQSGANLAWLATAPEAAALTGTYVSGRRPRASSAESYDRWRAEELWAVSEELVGLRPAAGAGSPRA